MSIDLPTGAFLPSTNGELQRGPLTPMSIEFEKLKSELGFIDPPEVEAMLEDRSSPNEDTFNDMVNGYVSAYIAGHELSQHEKSDVYPFRGILVSVAQIYYERQYFRKGRSTPADRARNYQYKEYLRTVDDDMRFLGEPENEHLEKLFESFAYDEGGRVREWYEAQGMIYTPPKLPKPELTHKQIFNTNAMRTIVKIDHNLFPILSNQ